MQYHRAFGPRLTLFVTCLLLVAGFASPAVAQDGSTDISFTVSAYTCEQDPGTVSVAAGNIPGDCVPTAGVSFTVATDDGSFSDVCTTDDSGNCSVMVPNEATVTVTEDTSTAPANTAPRENPITTEAVTEFAGALFINLPTGAPSAPEQIEFRISKYTCDTDPGDVSVAAGNIPDDCIPTSGVAFAVTAADGSAVGSCTTDDSGLCIVKVPNEAIVTVTEDTTTSPAGTAPRENPITTQAVTEFAGALFINLPTGGETPTQVPVEPTAPVELPNTGAGTTSTTPDSGVGMVFLAVTAAAACGAVGMAVRRQSS